MGDKLEQEVIAEIQNGRKIAAIKKLRELRGIGLKESKELVDSYCSKNKIAQPSGQRIKSNDGLILLILIGIAAYFLYRYFG